VTADEGSTAPYSPPGGPFTPPPSPSVPPPPTFGSGGGRRPRGGGVAIALGIVAIVLAVAALIVALVRGGGPSTPATPTAQPTTSSTTAPANTTAPDKALCEAIAPLIKESSARKNAFTDSGPDGSPERDAALQDFRDKTQDWVGRAQAALDEHADPPRFFTRTLQRYIDDMRMLASNLRPGPITPSNDAGWRDSVFALAGPYDVCGKLGIPLW
jgi:hypothetical protein